MEGGQLFWRPTSGFVVEDETVVIIFNLSTLLIVIFATE